MKFVRFAMIATSLLTVALCFAFDVLSAGGHGVFVLMCCLVPGVLGVYATVAHRGIPRWGAIVSAVSFLIVGMKTSGGPEGSSLDNLMMVGFLGLLLAVALAIKPDAAKA